MYLSQRLIITPAGDEEMLQLINDEQDEDMKQAYTEMYNGTQANPQTREFYTLWFIKLRSDGKPVGELCFKGLSDDGVTEIGYGTHEGYEGRGYMTEAVKTVIEEISKMPAVRRIEAEADENNAASIRILTKCGFVPTGETGKEGPRFVYKNDSLGINTQRKAEYRFASREDTALILSFIKELADYEKMSDEVIADEKLLEEWIFDKGKAEVLFALDDGHEAGFALFFHNFSTFLGRAGIYLEDLYVRPEYRGKGYGKGLITKLASTAAERGCGRLEWWCLDWNRPSIDFYLSLGAEPMSDWTTYRIAGEALKRLAE